MVSKHHACTSFGLKKKVEPALTALSWCWHIVMWVGMIRLLHIHRSSSHAPTSNFFTHIAAKQFPHPPSWMYTAVQGNWLNILLYSAVSSRHGSSQEFPSLVNSICTSSAPALEMHSACTSLGNACTEGVSKKCPSLAKKCQECVQECIT